MQAPLPLTVTVITLNEERNLRRALESVRFAKEIVVVDSGSTDRTREIADSFGARFVTNPWAGYGRQKNYAHSLAKEPWILNIDADESVSPELAKEIEEALSNPSPEIGGFRIPRKAWYLGRWILHGGWYPNPLIRLSRREGSKWTEPEVHEALLVEGKVSALQSALLHYPFGSLEDQVRANLRYAREGSRELRRRGLKPRIWKLLFKPLGKFLETYVWKAGFLDGLPGFLISVNAAHSMFLKQALLFEERLGK